MIGGTGCVFKGFSLAAGIPFQEKFPYIGVRLSQISLAAGHEYVISTKQCINGVFFKPSCQNMDMTLDNNFPRPWSKFQAIFSLTTIIFLISKIWI